MAKADLVRMTGQLPNDLANAVSDAIHAALAKGMAIDEAVCVVAGVAADYGRGQYGDEYLKAIADIVMLRMGQPMPGGAQR